MKESLQLGTTHPGAIDYTQPHTHLQKSEGRDRCSVGLTVSACVSTLVVALLDCTRQHWTIGILELKIFLDLSDKNYETKQSEQLTCLVLELVSNQNAVGLQRFVPF